MIPLLVISITRTDTKCYWKTHPKAAWFQSFLSNSAPKLWNALPQTIREADSSATFRRRLKAHLSSKWIFLFSKRWTHCSPKLFSVFPRLFFSVHFPSIISFSTLSIQVNGTMRYKNGHHHRHHHPNHASSSRHSCLTWVLQWKVWLAAAILGKLCSS